MRQPTRETEVPRAVPGLPVLLLLLSATNPAAAAVLREPYLQSPTPTSVVVMWQTDLATGTDSLVHYGTSLGVLGLSASGVAVDSVTDPGLRNHTVTITGLTPGTTYYYDVGTTSMGVEAGGTATDFFTTARALGSSGPFDFWVVGDSGNDSVQQRAVRDAMLATVASSDPPDLFLHVGDQAYDTGTNVQFTARVFAIYAGILRHTPYFPAVGNHEASDGASDSATQSGPYFESFTLPSTGTPTASGTEAYYAFDYANAHFIALDSDDSSTAPGSAQLVWLAADLAAVPASTQWIVAWFHHSPYSKGSHDSDNAADSGARMQGMRERVLPMLEAGGVDLVLSGHSHSYERSYLISGAYGFGTSPNFVTPSYAVLAASGHIVESGDGSPAGDGPYRKRPGQHALDGTLYVVAGHGGNSLGGSIDHPVMRFSRLAFGSCLVTVDATTLLLRNVRSDGVINDVVALHKPPLSCTLSSQCDDLRSCTIDSCVAGRCESTDTLCPLGQACDDATGSCVCVSGACDDSDACTSDACDSTTGCASIAIDCDDGDACTTDSCSPASGCAHAAVACDDGSACTTDACSVALGCQYAAVVCDDVDPCTDDGCDVSLGCVTSHNTALCDDGLLCTLDDQCLSGACAGTARDCASFSDECKSAACDPGTGDCMAVALTDGTSCSLGTCSSGVCTAPVVVVPDAGATHDASAAEDVDAGSSAASAASADPDPGPDAAAASPSSELDASSSQPPSLQSMDAALVMPPDASRADAALGVDADTTGSNAAGAASAADCGCRLSAHTRPSASPRWLWLLALAAWTIRRERGRC